MVIVLQVRAAVYIEYVCSSSAYSVGDTAMLVNVQGISNSVGTLAQ
jgi:hypothetical protein